MTQIAKSTIKGKKRNVTNRKTKTKKFENIASKKILVKGNNPLKKILVANKHTATIIIPRSVKGQDGANHVIALNSLVFPSGMTTIVDNESWDKVKVTNQMVRRYLDHGLISEVRQVEGIIATVAETSSPTPPEHLQTPAEIDSKKIRLEREDVGQITL